MAASHIAHNCQVGDGVILANGALLGGYVTVHDRAFLSASTMVHQFCRVGMLAILQGGTVATQDVPPFTAAHSVNELCGLNVVGLRRAGYAAQERLELKRLYHQLFRAGINLRQAIAQAKQQFTSKAAGIMFEFLENTKRGVCADDGSKLTDEPEQE
jgi:UDP-N-acetylglucosamine acyltransferase